MEKSGAKVSCPVISNGIHSPHDDYPCSEHPILDTVLEDINVHPLIEKLISTPEFQRLLDIRMLGPAFLVRHSGNHTRFEHCIGVSHRAETFVRGLQKRQPELGITNVDCLCLAIAGLFHDLGHGPFSHTFERFIRGAKSGTEWKHENTSIELMKKTIEENNLTAEFAKYGLAEIDRIFIQEIIEGGGKVGRGKEKWFLFEIVANKRNGIDVDRIDYMMRDHYNVPVCGFSCPNFDPLLESARVMVIEGERQICYDREYAQTAFDLFEIRHKLNERIYQEPQVSLVEQMVLDVFWSADRHLPLLDSNGETFHMSEGVENLQRFCLLGDSLYGQIARSHQPELKIARDIIRRIQQGDFYAFVGRTELVPQLRDLDLSRLAIELAQKATADLGQDVRVGDVLVIRQKLDFGMNDQNPMDHIWFYKNSPPNYPVEKISVKDVCRHVPRSWSEEAVTVYYRGKDSSVQDALQTAMTQWANQRRVRLFIHPETTLHFKTAHPAKHKPGQPDVIHPDEDPKTELKKELFQLYQIDEPIDTTIRTDEDALKRLDQAEAEKAATSRRVPGQPARNGPLSPNHHGDTAGSVPPGSAAPNGF